MVMVAAPDNTYHGIPIINNVADLPVGARPVDITSVFLRNKVSPSFININQGGARSSKSYSLSQLFIDYFMNKTSKKFLVTRKVMPSLRLTAYRLIVDLLKDYGYYQYCKHNKTECTIEYRNNLMVFTGIDDPQKIKSAEWNYAWFEEANEFTYDDFQVVYLRMSAPTPQHEPNQLFLSFNPDDDETGWIRNKFGSYDPVKQQYDVKRSDVNVIHSTYLDNPHLSTEYRRLLIELKEQDEDSYKVYTLGGYGKRKEIVFNFAEIPTHPDTYDDVCYGLDFGFNNPMAFIRVAVKDAELFLRERLYQTHLTTKDFIDKLPELMGKDSRSTPIYCDAAEPDRIQELVDAGYNALPADKGPGSVRAGIMAVKGRKVFTHPENVNLNKEVKRYRWRKDKSGNILDEVIKLDDHALDAVRMAVFTHLKDAAPPLVRFIMTERDKSRQREEGSHDQGPAEDGGVWFTIAEY